MVGFLVYEDFMSYSSGIYEVTTDQIAGGHAVKMIGWGDDSGRLYWICQNQWDTTWGESGFFRIYEGESGIDTVGVACSADI
jgi:cathepsin B